MACYVMVGISVCCMGVMAYCGGALLCLLRGTACSNDEALSCLTRQRDNLDGEKCQVVVCGAPMSA